MHSEHLKGTVEKEIICKPNTDKGLEVHFDSCFTGSYDRTNAEESASVCSRTGFNIKCANCPITWKSKLQTRITVSTTETQCIVLLTELLETTLLMQLQRETCIVMKIEHCSKSMKCTVFEDNNGAVETANAPKISAITKQTSIKCHHFRTCVSKGDIKLIKFETSQLKADFLTKLLHLPLICYLRRKVLGW